MIIFHALAVLILLLLFIFRLSRAFCWFYDWFFRVLGGDGSAIDWHLERTSGGVFQLTRGKRFVMQFFRLLEDGEIFSSDVFPIDMWCNNAWAEAETRSKVERKRISFIKSFLDGSLKALERFILSSTVRKPTRRSFRFSSAPSHPTDSVKFEDISIDELFRHSLIIIKF